MSALPKVGTLESIVLAKMIAIPTGVTYLDFPEDSELHNPDKLDQVVQNLRNGMFEAEDDNSLRFDA